eukprot:scaffold4859_cov128-Isochrysis_galbana.AAC.4
MTATLSGCPIVKKPKPAGRRGGKRASQREGGKVRGAAGTRRNGWEERGGALHQARAGRVGEGTLVLTRKEQQKHEEPQLGHRLRLRLLLHLRPPASPRLEKGGGMQATQPPALALPELRLAHRQRVGGATPRESGRGRQVRRKECVVVVRHGERGQRPAGT